MDSRDRKGPELVQTYLLTVAVSLVGIRIFRVEPDDYKCRAQQHASRAVGEQPTLRASYIGARALLFESLLFDAAGPNAKRARLNLART